VYPVFYIGTSNCQKQKYKVCGRRRHKPVSLVSFALIDLILSGLVFEWQIIFIKRN